MKQIDNNILSFFTNRFGFHFDEDKKNHLKYLLNNRKKKIGLINDKEYLKFICSHGGKDECQYLINAFTVGETYFFRNKYQWKALKSKIFPEIIKRKLNNNDLSLRIWSAGCSTGEESYSLAIIITEIISYYQSWKIEILATDLNESSLDYAKKGVYTENAFRDTPDNIKNKYFSKRRGKYKIQSSFKKMITFEQLNLISNTGYPKHYASFDIIFCRNVLIYFSNEIAKKTLRYMYNALNNDGYIFLGHTEGLIAKDFNLKPLSFENSIIYQKQDVKFSQFQPETFKKNFIEQEKIIKQRIPAKPQKNNHKSETPSKSDLNNTYDSALQLFNLGKIDDAQKMLNKHNENQSLYSLLLVGLIYIQKKDIHAAQVILKETQLIYDLTPETHMFGARIHEAENKISEAITGCHNAIFLDQSFFYPHFRLGEIYRKLGEQGKMKRSFNNALKNLHIDNSERFKLFCAGYSTEFLEDYIKSIFVLPQ